MGALATAWQARLSTQVQIGLTNPDNEGATSVDSTRLAAAETDTQADFQMRTGLEFDDSVAAHIAAGIKGITYFLYSYRSTPRSQAADAARDDWEKACDRVARVLGSLAWAEPLTNSTLSPSSDPVGDPLPYFDRQNFDIIPPPPSGVDPNDYPR